MKIAILAHLSYPIREPYAGGLERHTAQLADGLVGLGHAVTLFAKAGSESRAEVVPVGRYSELGRRLRARPFDLVHNNTVHYRPILLAAFSRIPFTTTLHTPAYRSLRWVARLTRPLGRNHRIAISHSLGRSWCEYVGDYRVIHNGIDPDRWPFSQKSTPKTAFWYGRIAPEKGLTHALLACREAGYSLRFAGPIGDQDYHDREVKPLLWEGATYLGHLRQDELAAEAARSAVGLFTSVWEEPFGLVLTEFLACGTPVAGFASGAAAEIVTRDCGELVTTGDTAALARAIPRAAELDRSVCRARVVDHFSLEKMLLAYAALFAELVKASGPRRN